MKPKHVVTSMILLAIAVFISNAWSLTADQTSPPRTPQSDRQTLIALDLLTRAAATHVSPLVELSTPNALITCPMIYHCIRYTIDPHKLADFEIYARRNMQGG